MGLAFALAETLLHGGQLLFLLLDLLVEQLVLIFEEFYLGQQFVHLDGMLFAGVFEGCKRDVLPCDQVLHVFRGICLFFRGEMVIEVYFFDLRFFLLGPGPLLELLIGDDDAVVLLVRPGVLLLDLLNQLLDLEIICQFFHVFGHAARQFLPLHPHFLCQFEHFLLVAVVRRVAVRGRLAFLLRNILVALLEVFYLAGEGLDVLILLLDYLLQLNELLFLRPLLHPLLHLLLAFSQQVTRLLDLLLYLLLDAQVAYGTEGVELCLCLFELPELGIARGVQFGPCIVGAIVSDAAHAFSQVTAEGALPFSHWTLQLLLLHIQYALKRQQKEGGAEVAAWKSKK